MVDKAQPCVCGACVQAHRVHFLFDSDGETQCRAGQGAEEAEEEEG